MRSKWALKPDAIPTVFPDLPNYLSKTVVFRKEPTDRWKISSEQLEQQNFDWMESDKIHTLPDIILNTAKFNLKDFHLINKKDTIFFLMIKLTDVPSIQISFSINQIFEVKIYHGAVELNIQKFKFLLGSDLKCNLYSKLENLISYLNNSADTPIAIEDEASLLLKSLKSIANDNTFPESKAEKIHFLEEQLGLVFSNRPRYSPDFIIFASVFFYTFPAAYRFLRDSNILTLPHPNYVRSFNIGTVKSGNVHTNYLSEKIKHIEPHEKYVHFFAL